MMKKTIYGLVILIGILTISTNFMMDESNVDFKNAKASGTACRWISESGYGMGPHYVTEPTDYNQSQFNLLMCNSANSGDKKDGYLIYNEDATAYTGMLKVKTCRPDGTVVCSAKYYFADIENGLALCEVGIEKAT